MTQNLTNSLDHLPLMLMVEEAGQVLRIGRNSVYEIVRCGRLRSVHVGRKSLVPKEAIAMYISGEVV